MRLGVRDASAGCSTVLGGSKRTICMRETCLAPGPNPFWAVLFMNLLWMSIPFLLMGPELASPLQEGSGAEEAG